MSVKENTESCYGVSSCDETQALLASNEQLSKDVAALEAIVGEMIAEKADSRNSTDPVRLNLSNEKLTQSKAPDSKYDHILTDSGVIGVCEIPSDPFPVTHFEDGTGIAPLSPETSNDSTDDKLKAAEARYVLLEAQRDADAAEYAATVAKLKKSHTELAVQLSEFIKAEEETAALKRSAEACESELIQSRAVSEKAEPTNGGVKVLARPQQYQKLPSKRKTDSTEPTSWIEKIRAGTRNKASAVSGRGWVY